MDEGGHARVTATPDEGYTFVGWFNGDEKVSENASYSFVVTENVTLTARFTKNPYTVFVGINTGGSINPGGTVSGGGTFEEGESATATAVPDPGFRLVGWFVDDVKVSEALSYTFTVTKDLRVLAKFERIRHTVTVNATVGGTTSGSFTMDEGGHARVTATPDEGYTFVGWFNGDEKVSENASYSFVVTENVTLTARFAKKSYTVTVTASEGGSVSGGGTFECDTSANVNAAANTGYVFAGWFADGTKVSDSASYTFTVTKDVTLTAKFEKNTQLSSTIAIRNFKENKTVDYRTTITFTAEVKNPADGAKTHWFIDGKDAGTGDTYTVKEAKKDFNVQAKYIKDGKVLAESDTETVKVNSGFFAKLKAFFRGLFGKLPVVVQEYLGVEFIDRIEP